MKNGADVHASETWQPQCLTLRDQYFMIMEFVVFNLIWKTLLHAVMFSASLGQQTELRILLLLYRESLKRVSYNKTF